MGLFTGLWGSGVLGFERFRDLEFVRPTVSFCCKKPERFKHLHPALWYSNPYLARHHYYESDITVVDAVVISLITIMMVAIAVILVVPQNVLSS